MYIYVSCFIHLYASKHCLSSIYCFSLYADIFFLSSSHLSIFSLHFRFHIPFSVSVMYPSHYVIVSFCLYLPLPLLCSSQFLFLSFFVFCLNFSIFNSIIPLCISLISLVSFYLKFPMFQNHLFSSLYITYHIYHISHPPHIILIFILVIFPFYC